MISFPQGTKVWLAAGKTDMRRGIQGLGAIAQTVLKEDPLSGHVFVFRGRNGDRTKLLYFDGQDNGSDGTRAKRRFPCPERIRL